MAGEPVFILDNTDLLVSPEILKYRINMLDGHLEQAREDKKS